MKKIKKCMIAIVVFATVIINSTGCESKPIMDEDKCAELALEYMKNKYQKDFELVSSVQNKKVIGRKGYATVRVLTDEEKKYRVIVYPDGEEDTDKDGYYDSYKVISDDYMCKLVEENVKVELDYIINKAGLKQFISNVYVDEICRIDGFCGFASDFYIENGNDNLDALLNNKQVYIIYKIEVPESEFNIGYEESITEILKPKISEDVISVYIESYPEEIYLEREKIYKENGYEKLNMLKGTDEIDFFIEEETNESK